MHPDTLLHARALIDDILTRYHDGHRQALPGLLVQAAAAEAAGGCDGLTAGLKALADGLEQHLFKEEMRLFPMMEQGGNTLIGHLIDDLHREHRTHDDALQRYRARVQALADQAPAGTALAQLRQGLDALAQELAQHMHREDDELFPLFKPPLQPAGRG